MLYLLAVIAVFAWVLGFNSVASAAAWALVVLLFANLLVPVIAGPVAIMLTELQPKASTGATTREPWWA